LLLPPDDDVIELRASLREFEGAHTSVPEFVVPPEQIATILEWLRPPKYNTETWPLNRIVELGELIIRTRSGEELRLRFYWTGKNPVVYSRDGIDQFYGKWLDNDGRGMDGGMCLYNAVWKASETITR
jgi:hypothetical protein